MDRLTLILSIFANAGRCGDGRPTSAQLRELTRFSPKVLSPNYSSARSAETVERIGRIAADLLNVDPEKMVRWLSGRAEPALQAYLELEARKVRCTGTGPHTPSVVGLNPGWYDLPVDEGNYTPALRQCRACSLRKAERVGDTWAEKLLANSDLPYEIRHAVQEIQRTGRTVTYEALIDQLAIDRTALRRLLAQHGAEKPRKNRKHLDKWISVAALLRALSGDPADHEAPQPVAIFCGKVTQKRKKKDRRGRRPGEPAAEHPRRGDHHRRAARGARRPAAADQLRLFIEAEAGGCP